MPPQIEDYDVLDVIGSGSFGTCFKVRQKVTEELFVWKAIDYGNLSEESKKNLVSEVNLLSKLDHPNIVKYYDRILHKETTTLYIIMEWCQGGDLGKLVKSAKSTGQLLKEQFIWRVLYQVSKAVHVCHTTLCRFTVLHRDIKPANVFLDADGNAKLGDFGLARIENLDEGANENLVGTPYYMSPEVIRGQRYNRKSDIWALGCLIYELCALTPPFKGSTLKDLQNNIKSGLYAPVPNHYSENLVKIISFMLSVKHEYRPTVEMVLLHPLVVQNINSIQKPNSIENMCAEALRNLSMATEAEDVTQNLFKEKWLHRLEALRELEAKLKKREEGLIAKERTLVNKEKHLELIERRAKDRLTLADSYLNRKKDSRVTAMMNDSRDTEFSADPGDTSVLPTSAKLNPQSLSRPKFVRTKSERHSRHVTFNKEVRQALKENGRPESRESKSHSSESSGLQEPKCFLDLPKLSNRNPLKPLSVNSGSSKTLVPENFIPVEHKKRSERKSILFRSKTSSENVAPLDAASVVIRPNKKPDKTFKLIHFI